MEQRKIVQPRIYSEEEQALRWQLIIEAILHDADTAAWCEQEKTMTNLLPRISQPVEIPRPIENRP